MSRHRVFLVLAVLVIVALILSSCPEDDDHGDNPCENGGYIYDLTKVEYYIDEMNILYFDNETDSSYDEDARMREWNVTWFCAEYGKYDNAYVSLTFRDTVGDGQGWVLEEEFIDPDGICNWGCY